MFERAIALGVRILAIAFDSVMGLAGHFAVLSASLFVPFATPMTISGRTSLLSMFSETTSTHSR